jgi:hypothetical protein
MVMGLSSILYSAMYTLIPEVYSSGVNPGQVSLGFHTSL